jgi:hypothetical protein
MKTKDKLRDLEIIDSKEFLKRLKKRKPPLSKKERKFRKKLFKKSISLIDELMKELDPEYEFMNSGSV